MNAKLSIKQAVQISGLSENYIRKSIAAGKLAVTKELIGETKVEKNWIDSEVFEAWRNSAGTHSKREDGRNKFVIYMTADEEEQLRNLLADSEFVATLARANQKPAAE